MRRCRHSWPALIPVYRRSGCLSGHQRPGAIHLLNGLYDAKMDHQSVVAIVGQQARSAMGGDYQQEVDLVTLFKDVAGEYVHMATVAAQIRHLVVSKALLGKAVIPDDVPGCCGSIGLLGTKPSWEQRIMNADPKFKPSHVVPDFHFARYAEMLGLTGIRVDQPEQIGPAWDEALAANRPVVIEAVTDPEVPPLPPHITFKQQLISANHSCMIQPVKE